MTKEQLELLARESANSLKKTPAVPRRVKDAGIYTGFMQAVELLLPILEKAQKDAESNRVIAQINSWAATNSNKSKSKLALALQDVSEVSKRKVNESINIIATKALNDDQWILVSGSWNKVD